MSEEEILRPARGYLGAQPTSIRKRGFYRALKRKEQWAILRERLSIEFTDLRKIVNDGILRLNKKMFKIPSRK